MGPAAPTRQTVEHLLCVAKEESGRHVLAQYGEPPVAKRVEQKTCIAVESLGAEICHRRVGDTGGEARWKKGTESNEIGSGH
jgi:hypothetical protein